MSYIVKHLLPLNELIRQLKQNPHTINYYRKYDTFIGDADSVQYIKQQLNKINE